LGLFFIFLTKVKVVKEPISIATSFDTSNIDFIYNISLMPVVTLTNYLPLTLQYKVSEAQTFSLELGQTAALVQTTLGSVIYFEIKDYLEANWYGSIWVAKGEKKEERSLIQFRSSHQQVLQIGLFCLTVDDTVSYKLYAPYWIVNKTSLTLEYAFSSDSDVYELDEKLSESPVLLNCSPKVFSSTKTQILLRVKNTTGWSKAFIIDTVGSNGAALCSSKDKNYEIAVQIKLSDTGLTKIITLTPYFLIVNETNVRMCVSELESNEWQDLKPNSLLPFWPMLCQNSKQKKCIRLKAHDEGCMVSKPVWFNCKHSTTLQINTKQLDTIYVECEPSESVVKTRISGFGYGKAPVLIVNRSKNFKVTIKEDDQSVDKHELGPKTLFLYTWHNPIGNRKLRWTCGSVENELVNLDTIESKSNYSISDIDAIHCLVFLDGLQKVLMFTDDLYDLNEEVNLKNIFTD
jgi:vacuolar protein sorting-associated protein 13A/C